MKYLSGGKIAPMDLECTCFLGTFEVCVGPASNTCIECGELCSVDICGLNCDTDNSCSCPGQSRIEPNSLY